MRSCRRALNLACSVDALLLTMLVWRCRAALTLALEEDVTVIPFSLVQARMFLCLDGSFSPSARLLVSSRVFIKIFLVQR